MLYVLSCTLINQGKSTGPKAMHKMLVKYAGPESLAQSISPTKLHPTLSEHKTRSNAQLLRFSICAVHQYVQPNSTCAKAARKMFVKLTLSCFEKSNAQNAFEHVRPKLNWLKSSSAAQIFFFIVASSDVRDSFPKKLLYF